MDLQIVCTIYSGFLYSCIFPLFLELFSLTSLLPEKRNVQYKKYEKLEMVCPVFFFAFYVCFFFLNVKHWYLLGLVIYLEVGLRNYFLAVMLHRHQCLCKFDKYYYFM